MLLELDRDHLCDRVRATREYGRLWGSYKLARRLVSEYEAERRTWVLRVPKEGRTRGRSEAPELLRKSANGGAPGAHNLIDIESEAQAPPVAAALGPPTGPGKGVGTAEAGVSTTGDIARRAAHRRACGEGLKPSEVYIRRAEDEWR